MVITTTIDWIVEIINVRMYFSLNIRYCIHFKQCILNFGGLYTIWCEKVTPLSVNLIGIKKSVNLSACTRITVVVCVCVFQGTYTLCGLHCKLFVQKFRWHLLTTAAFFASWPALDGQWDSDGFFSRRLVYKSSNRSYDSTDTSLITVDC